jgi:hypothetical protein
MANCVFDGNTNTYVPYTFLSNRVAGLKHAGPTDAATRAKLELKNAIWERRTEATIHLHCFVLSAAGKSNVGVKFKSRQATKRVQEKAIAFITTHTQYP